MGSPMRAAATTMPMVTAAPAMSHFMSPMDAAGLMHRPPASNVRPLPTNTTRFFALAGLYTMCATRGGVVEPMFTARNSAMRSLVIHFSSYTLQVSVPSLTSSAAAAHALFAASASATGWMSFGGPFTRSRARLTASPSAFPSRSASRRSARFLSAVRINADFTPPFARRLPVL
jgi:hypothetical protein